jgi:broad specificity phosphatase PhoE
MAVTRVLLMRHAETAIPGVFHGAESDVGLSDRGLRQARAIAPILAMRKPDAVVSSGMKRAINTAMGIAEACGVDLRIEPLLHERRVGMLSGLATSPENPLWAETVRHWMAGELHSTTERAESFEEMRARLLPVWERMTTEFSEKTVIVVAHGLVSKVLMLSLLPDWPVSAWQRFGPIPNLAISELVRLNGVWRAESRNVVPEIIASLP